MRIIWSLMVLFLSTNLAWASQRSQVKEANELFKKQQWDSAIDHYLNALESKEHADIVQYDLGTAFYKQGNYDQAIEHLRKSVSDKNKDLSRRAYYNLGNAFYQKGRALEDKMIDESISALQQSLNNYEKVLNFNTKDKDAQYNRQVVENELERLKKKEAQKKQQQDQSKQDEAKDKESKARDQQVQEQQQGTQEDKVGQKASEQKKTETAKDLNDQVQKQILVKKETKELLEEYEREDAPKGLLNFVEHHKGESHVDKDW